MVAARQAVDVHELLAALHLVAYRHKCEVPTGPEIVRL
jgi:hypothetical protein